MAAKFCDPYVHLVGGVHLLQDRYDTFNICGVEMQVQFLELRGLVRASE
jgi:hypothetical protein